MNSHWLRGYGDPPPQTLIVVGMSREFVVKTFEFCELRGHVTNRYRVRNSTIEYDSEIFVCLQLRKPWPQFWKRFRCYG